MQSNLSRGRHSATAPFALVGLSLLLASLVPSRAGTPHAAPLAAIKAGPAVTADAPTPKVPATPPSATDSRAQASALKAAVTAGSGALKKSDGAVQEADALQRLLQSEAAPVAGLSLSARGAAFRGVPSDIVRVEGLNKRLNDAQGEQAPLKVASKALNDALTDAEGSTDDDVLKAVHRATEMQDAVTQRTDMITTLTGADDGSFTHAILALSKAIKKLTTDVGAGIDQNPVIADPAADRVSFSQSMAGLTDLLTTRARLRTSWIGALHQSLLDAGVTAAALPSDADFGPSDAEKSAAAGLAGRFQKLAQDLAGPGLSAPADVSAYAGRVQQAIRSQDLANADVRTAASTLATVRTAAVQLRRIVDAWSALHAAWLRDDPDGADALVKADQALSDRTADIALIADAADRIDEALSGDMNDFVTDQVRLFYFTDVERIMQALSSTVRPVTEGQGSAQARADQARQDLLDAEANVSQNLTAVNEAKTRPRTVQEDVRLVRARAADAQARAKTANVLYSHLLQQQRDAQKSVAAATTAGNKDLATQLTQQNQFSIDQRVTDAQAALVAQKKQATDAQDAATQLDDESAAQPQKLLDARSDLSAARQTLDRQRALAAGLAELESEAFASGRDHAPSFRSDARALSTDPVRRVILLGYPDSNTIFVRGLSKDVEVVKDMIAEFDRPAPQARITLWTLQVNGTDTQKLADIMQNIDQHLLLSRTLTGLVQDRLRDSLSFMVSHVQDRTAPLLNLPADDSQARLLRYQFYQPEVLSRLGYDLPTPPLPPLSGFPAKLAELATDDSYVTRFTLPDPAHATTLGEMLFVLSLGRKQYREAVLARFLLSLEAIPTNLPGFGGHHDDLAMQQERLQQFTRGLKVIAKRNVVARLGGNSILTSDPHVIKFRDDIFLSNSEIDGLIAEIHKKPGDSLLSDVSSQEDNRDSFYPRFPAAILGSFTDFGMPPLAPGSEETTANQNEILLAVQAQARENIATEIKALLQRLDDLSAAERSSSPSAHTFRMQYLPLVGFLYSKYNAPRKAGPNVTWLQKGLLAVGALDKSLSANLLPLDLIGCEDKISQIEKDNEAGWKDLDRAAWQIASLSGEHNSLSRATPRVAAADDMIKRLIITIEDDLDYFFVQPELSAIQQETARKGIELGTFQRESLLATNRRVARIDPRAGADVELTGGVDFLQEASQLGQLYDRFRQEQTADKLTSSGPAALAGTLSLLGDRAGSALGAGAALSLLGDLFTQPQPVGEIYSINSGNLFKVTPIFDPSGQALRFQFDYAGTTDVREPDGTTNPSLPRVERHTVNTDVQLTNLELREVSRFEANSALGTPEQRTGGLPLLKHLPILKDIPLIGYFARTAKKGAVRQESLIFAQTSMYPTVADIVNLLVDIPPLTGIARSEPRYLTSPRVPAIAPNAGNARNTPGDSMRGRSRAETAAGTSDFILPAGMRP